MFGIYKIFNVYVCNIIMVDSDTVRAWANDIKDPKVAEGVRFLANCMDEKI